MPAAAMRWQDGRSDRGNSKLNVDALAQSILNGLVSGGIYILVAVGMTLVLSITRIIQLAHGEIYMLGAYCVYYLCALFGVNFFLALIISMLLVGGLGIVLERFFFRPVRGNEIRSLIVGVGLMLVFQNFVLVTAGGSAKPITSPFVGILHVFGVTIPWERLAVVLLGLFLVSALLIFIHRTRIGQAMVAISEDREVATLQGINIDRISAIAMFLGCALAAVAGGLVGSMFSVSPFMGSFALMKGIAVIILGGLGSITGAIIGGFILGLIDGLIPALLNTHIAGLMGFGIIILILLFRPQGILGHE
jgi:branched-chain amino acid transport system permease protein